MGDRIEAIFRTHRRCCGNSRIQSDLADKGLTCALTHVRILMQERGLKAIQPSAYGLQTSAGGADAPYPNPCPTSLCQLSPTKFWTATFASAAPFPCGAACCWRSPCGQLIHPPSTGGLYLPVVIDLCSLRIVSWALESQPLLRRPPKSPRLPAPAAPDRGPSFTATAAANTAAGASGISSGLLTPG